MPAAIPAIIAAVQAITVQQVLFTVASFAISTAMSNRAQKKAEAAQRAAAEQQRAAFNAGLVDRTTVIRSAIQPRNIVLGRDEVSGPLACWFTYGAQRNFHAFAVVLAGHECDAIETIMFNHEAVTLDGSGAVIAPAKYTRTVSNTYTERFEEGVAVVLSRTPTRIDSQAVIPEVYYDGSSPESSNALYRYPTLVTYTVVQVQPLFYIKKYLGAPGQAAAPELVAAATAAGIPSAWQTDRKGTSVCYLTCVMEADFNILGQIGVPNVSAIVRGVKAYDARTGLTAWTQNPPVLARWFQVDSGYAPETLSSEIHAAELLASANVCDESVAFSATRTEARYTCNGQLTTAASPLDNLNHILDSMDGDAVWISGQWQLVAGYYKAPTLEIDEDTLSSAGITVAPRTAKRDLFNGISGTFVNPAAGYVRMGYSMVTSTVYQAQDGGELLPAEANFELVNDPIRCQMIAWQRLTRARQPLTLQLGTTLKGYDSAPLQNVNVNLARLGYVDKVFTNLRREFENNTLLYILQETGPAVWDWNYANANAAVDIPNTSFPDVATIAVVSDIEVNSGTDALQLLGDGTVISRVRLRWTQATSAYVLQNGKVEWQHKRALTVADDWTALPPAAGSDTEIFTGPLVDGDLMHFRARFVTGQGRIGDWCPVVTTTVIGKTELPRSIATFTIDGQSLQWSAVDDIDLAGYQVRFNYGNNPAWGTGVPLHVGVITASPWTPDVFPTGQITLMVKAQDTTGNQSATAAVIVANLGDVIVDNLILSYDDKAAGFPGTKTNASVSGGNLVADDSGGLFWGADGANFWGADTSLFWPIASYLQLTYVTRYTVRPDEAGSRLTLAFEITGDSYTVEYAYGTQGLFWGNDADYFWGADAAPFWPPAAPWQTWPGAIPSVEAGEILFRITTQAGPVQGAVSQLTLNFDVEDEFEEINDVVVSALGTRLTLAKAYRSIKNVQLTLQDDGGTAISALTLDKLATGPQVAAINSSGTQVTGLLDARIQGVKG